MGIWGCLKSLVKSNLFHSRPVCSQLTSHAWYNQSLDIFDFSFVQELHGFGSSLVYIQSHSFYCCNLLLTEIQQAACLLRQAWNKCQGRQETQQCCSIPLGGAWWAPFNFPMWTMQKEGSSDTNHVQLGGLVGCYKSYKEEFPRHGTEPNSKRGETSFVFLGGNLLLSFNRALGFSSFLEASRFWMVQVMATVVSTPKYSRASIQQLPRREQRKNQLTRDHRQKIQNMSKPTFSGLIAILLSLS